MSVVQSSFTIHRVYDAPVEMVFQAFADPKAKARWFARSDGGWEAAIREQDFRVGGRDRTKGVLPNGHTSDFQCEYRDIVENERIVYVYDMFVDDRKISVSLAIVQFAREGKATRLSVTEHGAFLDGYDDAGGREHGTGLLLDQLGQSLAGALAASA
ncbi:MAG TPA: SRPBCC family protein [Rhizomicrobium sp.]|nr:SRPBCC family protein [Rhizomicrobium sp.]